MLAFSVKQLYTFFNKLDPSISTQIFLADLDLAEPISPPSFGFDIAFGIDKQLDPSIGYLSLTQVSYDYVDKNGTVVRIKNKKNLPLVLCSNNSFIGFN